MEIPMSPDSGRHVAHIPKWVRTHPGHNQAKSSRRIAFPMWVCGYIPNFPLTHVGYSTPTTKRQHTVLPARSYEPTYPHSQLPTYPYTHVKIIRCGTSERTKQRFKC